MEIFTKSINVIIVGIIKFYQLIISPVMRPSCRHYPTCSEYSIEALKNYGLIRGIFMSIKRILSCHPIKFLGGGEGFDPVNKKMKAKK